MSMKAFAVAAGISWGVLLFVFTLLEAARDFGNTLEGAVGLVSRVFRHLSGQRGRSGLWICQRATHRRGLLLAL